MLTATHRKRSKAVQGVRKGSGAGGPPSVAAQREAQPAALSACAETAIPEPSPDGMRPQATIRGAKQGLFDVLTSASDNSAACRRSSGAIRSSNLGNIGGESINSSARILRRPSLENPRNPSPSMEPRKNAAPRRDAPR